MDLKKTLGMDTLAYEGLEHRARVPKILRDLVNIDGAVEVTISMSAKTALRMADDIEYAVTHHPHGFPMAKSGK